MAIFSQIKRLSKDTLFYGLGSAVQGFIVFLLFPIYTRVLSKADFGAQDLVLTAVTVTTFFIILGLDSGTARNYYDVDLPEEKQAILSTWLFFELIVMIPVCGLVALFAGPICQAIFDDASLAPILRLGVVSIPFSVITRVFTLTLRLTFKAVRFSIIIISGALAQAASAVLFVVVLQLGVRGVFLAMITAYVVQIILGIFLTISNFRLTFSTKFLRCMLAFGVPLVPASLSLWVLNYSNRYFLTRLGSMDDVGAMAAGVRISAILIFAISAFQNAWPPFAYSLIKDQDLAKRTYTRILTYYLLVTISLAGGLALFGRELLLFLATSAYESSSVVIPWLVFSSVAWGVVNIVGIGFEIAKKSYHFSIAAVLGAVITTVLNILLIPGYGIAGAAVATLMGNLAALIYCYQAAQRYFTVRYEIKKITALLAAVLVSVVLGVLVDRLYPTWSPVLIAYKTGIFGLFLLLVLVLRVITWDEIRHWLTDLRNRLASRTVKHVVE